MTGEQREVPAAVNREPFSRKGLLAAWLHIGCTSFGGGAITQYLIQEQFIYKKGWISEAEYASIIGMCQLAPGINIIAYTILIGKRLDGWCGIALSVLGLILPSAAITVLISALYSSLSAAPRIQAALHTVFAAIFGVSLATNWRNVRPILRRNYRLGSGSLAAVLLIAGGSAGVYWLWQPPVAVLYLVGGVSGALLYTRQERRRRNG